MVEKSNGAGVPRASLIPALSYMRLKDSANGPVGACARWSAGEAEEFFGGAAGAFSYRPVFFLYSCVVVAQIDPPVGQLVVFVGEVVFVAWD
jgi:hypothetical protein